MDLRWSIAGMLLLSGCGGGAALSLGEDPFDTGGSTATTGETGGETNPVEDDSGVEEVPGVGDRSVEIYDQNVVIEFGITLSSEAMQSLRVDPYSWVEGSFTYDGRTWERIGVRLKGENSFLPIDEKPSLKIKFDKYVDNLEFHGLTELTLNNMSGDYSMMHERLAYLIYREAGVPAARSNHAWVTLNGEAYGLYANVETVDQAMITRWFEQTEGPLFEVWDVDFYDHYVEHFELEYGEDDRHNIQGLADALEGRGEAALAEAADHLDWAGFVNYWAVGMYVAQFDSYPYSNPGDDCHIYTDPATDTLHFIPHGVDETFYYPTSSVAWSTGIVGARCLDSTSCVSSLKQRVREVIDIADELDVVERFDEIQKQIKSYVSADRHRPYGLDYVNYYQDVMRQMLVDREAELTRQLGL